MNHNGIALSARTNSSRVDFYVNDEISASLGNASIESKDDGRLALETVTDVLIQGNLIVTGDKHTNTYHRYEETAVIYDGNDANDSPIYFGNVYLQDPVRYKCALSLISNDTENRSTSLMYMTSQNRLGSAIGGGVYPTDVSRAMSVRGIIDGSANHLFTPVETTVSSTFRDKYLATTGLNTYTPRTEKYILDVNGPLHIDNSDINSVLSVKFQVKYLNQAMNSSNYIMAVGTSIDISGSFKIEGLNAYRHTIYFSNNYGKTWRSNMIYPSQYLEVDQNERDALLKGDYLNQVSLYDASFAFITGNNNSMIYTFNGGYDWQSIIVRNQTGGALPTLSFNGIFLYPVTNPNGPTNTLSVYFTVGSQTESLDSFGVFDISLSTISIIRDVGDTLAVNATLRTTSIITIWSIAVTSTHIYVCGDKVVVYAKTNLNVPFSSYQNGSRYWTYINAEGSNAIAVGPETILSTKNNGTNWTLKIVNGYIMNDVSIYDTNRAIAVGDAGVIMITEDGGTTWGKIEEGSPYYNWINSSGKGKLLTNTDVNLRDIIIADDNTFLITDCTVDYQQSSPGRYGESDIYSCFFPNYLNYRNNSVLDICGNMDIYGDIRIHSRDGYNRIETDSSCTTFGFINSSSVLNMTIGHANTRVIVPGILQANTFENNYVNYNQIACDRYTSISDNLIFTNSGNIFISSEQLIIGDSPSTTLVQLGNSVAGSSAVFSIGGPTDTVLIQSPVSASLGLTVNGPVVIEGDISLTQSPEESPMQISGNIEHTGNLRVSSLVESLNSTIHGNVSVGGNLSLGGNLSVMENSVFDGLVTIRNSSSSLLSMDSSLNNMGIGSRILSPTVGSVTGTYNVGIGVNVMTQNAMSGENNVGVGQYSLYANETGNYNNAIGKRSLTSILSGEYNVGIGDYAVATTQTGNYNTGVGGANALQSLITGEYNCAFGTNAMQNVNNGYYNTAIGARAGMNSDNYDISNCTFLGAYATANIPGGTFGSSIANSTAIGYGATVTMDNQIVLGTSDESVYIPSANVGIAKVAVENSGFVLDVSGQIRCSGLNQSSDYRIKEDVCEIPTELSVDSLRPVYYKNTVTKKYEMGFLAHEVQTVLPFLVDGEKDCEDYQSMNYTGIIALLVREIQELKKKLNE